MILGRYCSLVMTRVTDEPTLVLHTRPYEDNALMVDMLTLNEGRLSAVRKDARGKAQGNTLQVFSLLKASWYGRGEVMTLTGLNNVQAHWLSGEPAAAAYYVVELIVRLVREREPVPLVFASACDCIARLAEGQPPSLVLRPFESTLLTQLGYGLDFCVDCVSGSPIEHDGWYVLQPNVGFQLEPEHIEPQERYAGNALLAIADGNYSSVPVRTAAKRIFQRALEPHLGYEPLRSRELLPPGASHRSGGQP